MLQQNNSPIDTLGTEISTKESKPNVSIPSDTLTPNSVEKVAISPKEVAPKPTGYFSLDTKDYDSYMKNGVYATSYMDEQRARLQPWSDQLANSVVKMGGLAATTFGETFTDLIGVMGYGLGKAAGLDVKFSDAYNNKITKGFDSFNELLEKKFPNYYTQQELDNNILQNMFGSGAANWWGDKFIKNIGFSAGVIMAGVATAGIGDWALGISRGSKIASTLIEGEKTLENANRLFEAGKLTRETLNAFKNSYNYLKTANAINSGISTFAAASTEAFIEGRNGINDYTTGRIKEYKEQYGTDPSGDIVNKYKEEAESLGNVRWALNLPLLMASDVIQFGKMFSRGFTKDATKLAESRFIDSATGKSIKDLSEKELLSSAGSVIYEHPRLMSALKVLKSPLTEGFQEIEQFHIEKTLADYYNKKYDSQGREQSASFVDSMTQGFNEAYGSKDGWEQAIIGGLTGIMGLPNLHGIQNRVQGREGDKNIMAGGIWEEIANNNEEKVHNEKIAQILNDPNQIKRIISSYDNFNTYLSSQKEYDQAIKNGDHFTAENAKYDDFASHIINNLENDSFDLFKSKLSAIGKLSNDDFSNMYGYKDVSESKRISLINSMSQKADIIKKYWDMTNTRFNDINSIAKIGPEQTLDLKNSFVTVASTLEDLGKRSTDLQNKISLISKGKITFTDIENVNTKEKDDVIRQSSQKRLDEFVKENPQDATEILKLTNDIKQIGDRRNEFVDLYNFLDKGTQSNTINDLVKTVNSIKTNVINQNYAKQQEEDRKAKQERSKTDKEVAKTAKEEEKTNLIQRVVGKVKDKVEEIIKPERGLRKGDKIQYKGRDYDDYVSPIEEGEIEAISTKTNSYKLKGKKDWYRFQDRIHEILRNYTEEQERNGPKSKTNDKVSLETLMNKITSKQPLEGGENAALQSGLIEQETALKKETTLFDNEGNQRTMDTLDTSKEDKDEYLKDIESLQKDVDNHIKELKNSINPANKVEINNKLDKLNNTKLILENHYNTIKDTKVDEELETRPKVEEVDKDIKEWMEQLSPEIEQSVTEKAKISTNKLIDILDKLKDKVDAKNFESFSKYLNTIDPTLFKTKYDKIRRLYNFVQDQDINFSYNELMKRLQPTVTPKDVDEGGSEERNKLIIRSVHKANNIIVGEESDDDSDIERQYARSEVGYNLIAYLSRAYYQVSDLFKGTKKRIDFDDKLVNNEPALDPDYLKVGDNITLRVQDRNEFIPFTKDGKTYTYDDVAKDVNSIPIIIEKDGNKIGFLHTTDWLNQDSIIGSEEDIQDQKDSLREIRQHVQDNGIVETTISDKTLGYLIRQSGNRTSKVSEAFKNPNLKIAIVKDGEFKVTNTASFKDKNPKANILNESKKQGSELIEGATYLMLDLGNDNTIGIPVTNTKINEQSITSIIEVIKAFTLKDNTTLDEIGNNGFNVRGSIKELERFIEQFIYNFDNINKLGEGNDLFSYLKKSTNSNEARININPYNIQFGKGLGIGLHEIEFDKNGITSVTIGNQKYNKNNSLFNEKVLDTFDALKENLTNHYSRNDITKLNSNKKVIGIEKGKVVTLYNNYNDFIKDNTSTNLQDFEYTNPITKQTKFINTIQGKVSIDTSFINKQKETISEVKEEIPSKKLTTEKSIISPIGTRITENNLNFGEEQYSPELETSETISTHPPIGSRQDELSKTLDESKDLRLRC